MKKVTSAALLAIKLSWTVALTVMLLGIGFQTFSVYQWLMPGGVPLQASFGFETMLSTVMKPYNTTLVLSLVILLIGLRTAASKGSKTVYTMNRLGLSELQITLIFGAVFTLYFLLYWAIELGLVYAYFVWYSRFSLVSSNAFMLAAWRSEWLHILLPLNEWWGYLRNVIVCLNFGYCAAFGGHLARHGKTSSLGCVFAGMLCSVMLNGRVGDALRSIGLMVLLTAYTIGYFFILKGGREDEDL